jgi:predicted Zn-dependent protease
MKFIEEGPAMTHRCSGAIHSFVRGTSIGLALAVVVACTENPYTHRSQLLLGSASQDIQMGAQAYAEVLHDPKVKLSQDPREVEPVKRVATRIIEAAKQSKYAETANSFEWEVTVIKDDKTMNAFALPGGKIAVYTGIFPVAKNEAGLAAILGHEVTHALARHGVERMSQGMLAQAAVVIGTLGAASQGIDPQIAQLAGGALAQYGYILPFSRTHESEADYIGLLLSAQAGYDPREAVHVWERKEQASKGQPPEFLSTHPGHGTRIKQLEGWMPEALSYYHPPAGLRTADLPVPTR